MTKREFIETREIVYVNAPIAPILQGDRVHYEDIAFKAQIGRIRTFSEQEIVKPYLEKFSALVSEHNMNDLADDEMSNFERGILKLINNLLSGSEGKE